MNIHALPWEDMQRYAFLFERFLGEAGFHDTVEIGHYRTEVAPSILYGAACEEDWYYDDYALTVPGRPGLVRQFGEPFVATLDENIAHLIEDDKLVLLRTSGG